MDVTMDSQCPHDFNLPNLGWDSMSEVPKNSRPLPAGCNLDLFDRLHCKDCVLGHFLADRRLQ